MKVSISDLVLIPPCGSRRKAIQNCFELATVAEKIGYFRIWYSEHHLNPLMLSSSPEVLIPIIAGLTTKIRVGSGGILLNNYSPFKIAEMFMLLADMFPNRIDLGIGRSSHGDVIDSALRRERRCEAVDDYSMQVNELLSWINNDFAKESPFIGYSIPNNPSKPSLYLLGSSISSSKNAAECGMNYAFADFFHPENTHESIIKYHENFNSVVNLSHSPYSILSFRIITGKDKKSVREQLAPHVLMSQQINNGTFNNRIMNPGEAIQVLGGLPQMQYELSFGANSPKVIAGTVDEIYEIILAKIKYLPIDEIMFQDLIVDQEVRKKAYRSLFRLFVEKSKL